MALAVAVIAAAAAPAWANVYASGLEQAGPASFNYVLNENADSGVTVEVWEVGGGMVYSESLGAQAKGAQSWNWNLTGYEAGKTYKAKITAADDGYGGWTQISTDDTPTSFYIPVGVSVNRNDTSSNFGSVYVSNAGGGTTGFGRNTPEGLYRLKADISEVDSGTAGVTWGGTSGPWKSAIGADDRVYVVDLSNDLVHDVAPDLSSAVQLIDASNRTANQWVGAVVVEGTQAAGNRKIYLANVNYNDTARKGLIQYDLGGNATVATGDTGTQYIGPSYYTYYPYDYVRDSNGDWYDVQYRYDATQAPAISKFLDSAPPINSAAWQTAPTGPGGETLNGGYCLDIYEPLGWVAYGNYYDGFVHVFNMADGSYITGFDAGTRMRDIAFDAAGNIYTVDNSTEWLRVWSPGLGANSFTTESGFILVPEPAAIILLALGGLACARRRRAA
jgi:hypothetical protein